MAAIDEGLCDKSFACATPFSGGMSSGCLCGAVAGAQLVIGYNTGRENVNGNEVTARKLAASVVEEFKNRNKFTCCKALTAGYEGPQRKEHCVKMVEDGAEILEKPYGSEGIAMLNLFAVFFWRRNWCCDQIFDRLACYAEFPL